MVGRAAEIQMQLRPIRSPPQQRKKERHQTRKRPKSGERPAGTCAPVTVLVRADASSGAGKAGRRACRPRPSRIRGRTFLRNAGTAPPPRAADETSSAHGASVIQRACRRARLACQEPFVYVRSPIGAAAGTDSELVWLEGVAGSARPRGGQLLHRAAASGANRRINLGKNLAGASRSLHDRQVNACPRRANARLRRRPERQFHRGPCQTRAAGDRASREIHPVP